MRLATLVHLKAVASDGEWIVEGYATTPQVDRVGDSVAPEGARFRLPLPLLFGHKHDEPIGAVFEANVTKLGIKIKARISKGVRRAEEVWTLIRDNALNAMSIGFIPLKQTPLPNGGQRILEWDWHELSVVAVPCNPGATLSVAKFLAVPVESVQRFEESKASEWWRNGPPVGPGVRTVKSLEDGKGRRVIEGLASTSTFNSHGYSLRAEGCDLVLPTPVLWRHERHSKIGEVTHAAVCRDGIWVRCSIDFSARGDVAWREIKAGRALAFSGAARNDSASLLKDPMQMLEGRMYVDWQLAEVSVTPKGANPDCKFHVVKDLPKALPTVRLISARPSPEHRGSVRLITS